MKKKINSDYCYKVFFHIALMTTMFQLLCPIYTLFTSIRIDYIALGILLCLLILDLKKFGSKAVFQNFKDVILKSKLLFIFCLLYFLWDTINLFYAKDLQFLVDKYLIWSKIGVLCLFAIYYVNPVGKKSVRKSEDIIINLGMTSIAISIASVIGYYTNTFTMYKRMLTAISDHNVFSSGIMIGFVAFSYWLITNKTVNYYIRMLILAMNFIICVPVMYLSASRRTIILIWIFLCWFIIYVIARIIFVDKKKGVKKIISFMLILCISFGLCVEQINIFNEYSTARYNKYKNDFSANINKNNSDKIEKSEMTEEVEVDEYVKTIEDGSGLDLRIIIWEASLKCYKDLSPIKKIIGGGASYQSDIFNDLKNPNIKEVVDHYKIKKDTKRWMGPHNFLLEDLLSGGIVKLILDLGIMMIVLFSLVKRCKYNKDNVIMLLSLYAVLLANLLMGGKFGLFGDRLTWIIITIDIIYSYTDTMKEKGNDI